MARTILKLASKHVDRICLKTVNSVRYYLKFPRKVIVQNPIRRKSSLRYLDLRFLKKNSVAYFTIFSNDFHARIIRLSF